MTVPDRYITVPTAGKDSARFHIQATSAIAGLSEGVITPSSIINCSGIYKKVTPNPKCWAYPSAHGSLNVSQAIQHSCNSFFYEVGYRLSLKQNGLNQIQSDNAEGKATSSYYSSDRGLNVLKKYAEKIRTWKYFRY